jgi:hypothetical protein
MTHFKSLLLVLCTLLLPSLTYSQTFNTVNSGNWTAPTFWSGSNVLPTSGNLRFVTIEATHNVVFNGSILYGSGCILTVNGTLTVNGNLSISTGSGLVINGTLTVNGDT